MAGRVLRESIRQEIRQHVEFDPQIVIAGLSNVYTHYITTEEEYDAQVNYNLKVKFSVYYILQHVIMLF